MYSQWNEDDAILPCFPPDYHGYYVDVGAADGVTFSNTLAFEERGWMGLCIEPHPEFYQQLIQHRRHSICINVGIWNKTETRAPFYRTANGVYSRFMSEVSNEALQSIGHPRNPIQTIDEIPIYTLDDLLMQVRAPSPLDLVSIDVEGTEWEILKGFTLSKWQPRIVIIEYTYGDFYDAYFTDYTCVESGTRWRTGTMDSANFIYCKETPHAGIISRIWRN